MEDFPYEGEEQYQKVDITVSEESTGEVGRSVEFVSGLLSNMLHLRSIVLVLKKILRAHELHLPFTGILVDPITGHRRSELVLFTDALCCLLLHVRTLRAISWGLAGEGVGLLCLPVSQFRVRDIL